MKKEPRFRMLSPISRLIARQLAYPKGWFGRVVMARALNWGNRELISATMDALALRPEDTFLDVGFGGGAALELAARRGVTHLLGIDPSPDAVAVVRGKLSGRAALKLWLERASVRQLPFADHSVDAILSTNTVYFWPDLAPAFRELHRVLRPGARLALGFSGADKLRNFGTITQHGFVFHETEAIADTARAAGFQDVQLKALSRGATAGDYLLLALHGT